MTTRLNGSHAVAPRCDVTGVDRLDAGVWVIDPDAPPVAARPMTDTTISVLVAAPVRLYREGLAAILARQEGIEVAGVAGDCSDTLVRWLELAPDVVLVDLAVEGSVETIRWFAEHSGSQGAAIAVLASSDAEDELVACVQAGVRNFVTRADSIAELALTLRSAARGQSRSSPATAATVFERIAGAARGCVSAPEAQRLTPREIEVMALIEEGLSNKEIAHRLSVALSTVKQHVHHILEKLQVSRRGEAVAVLRRRRVQVDLRSRVHRIFALWPIPARLPHRDHDRPMTDARARRAGERARRVSPERSGSP